MATYYSFEGPSKDTGAQNDDIASIIQRESRNAHEVNSQTMIDTEEAIEDLIAGPSGLHNDDDDADLDDDVIYENDDDDYNAHGDVAHETSTFPHGHDDMVIVDDSDHTNEGHNVAHETSTYSPHEDTVIVDDSDHTNEGHNADNVQFGGPNQSHASAKPYDNTLPPKINFGRDVFRTKGKTFDRFKIEISNLPNCLSQRQFNNFIESTLKFKPAKSKLFSKARIALVTFRNETQRQTALATFDKKKWKKKRMRAKVAVAMPDPGNKTLRSLQRKEALDLARKKFIEEAIEVDTKAKTAKKHDQQAEQVNPKRLNFTITPLWNVPYPEQLKMKSNFIVDTLQRLTDMLIQIPELKTSWLSREMSEGEGICCEVASCVPSPVINGYRNNCDFTVAEGITKEKTVGFRVGLFKDGFSGVVESTECVHITDAAKKIASYFQKYIRQSSLDVFDLHTVSSGYWQHLSVRTTVYGESMAIVQFNPQLLTKGQINAMYKDMTDFFTEGEGKECNLTSLYALANSTKSNSIVVPGKKSPMSLLYGPPCIYEVINGVKLRVAPKSYFQVNTKAAEKMINIMRSWMGDCAESLLLDICCGSGTIGLCLAKYVSKVIGIEAHRGLIEDAEKNAEMNDIKNAVFISGKVEQILTNNVFKQLPQKMPVIGIADPPRSGLHPKVIDGLRQCKGMDKLIFVACNTNTAYTNFVDLCRPSPPEKKKTKPFRLVKAVPIDFFPHSQHCLLLLFFDRDNSYSDTYKYYKFFY